ncbi:Dps family protein [Maliponia aquimaris]|uniref:Metalloregulation DNA-binding stress protein n=1 Tax=Maliponia aquimaris TaxID=1673631 RepID=A0A238L128_9RHOB|nr:DNA starvation/stationary phase protection protein [Maliponia aquimaris]SMX48785.1 Metalloregulation DNA-binding stress protein [Maliponia aquimaris]
MTTTAMKNPTTAAVKPDGRNTTPVAEALAEALTGTYRLVIKSHTYHWNVTGPLFYAIHNLSEEQYTDMFAAADVIAERIRALGKLASVTLAEPVEMPGGSLTADEMVKDLLSDHERMARQFHALVETAESQKDPATADLATERAAFHEKAAWMWRATAG